MPAEGIIKCNLPYGKVFLLKVRIMKKTTLSVRDITELGIFIALAIVLDLAPFKIRIDIGPGSISLTMLPLLIIALRFNIFKSFIGIGIVYGLITCLMDGYGIVTYPLDYLLAYGSLSLVSLFRPLIFKSKKPTIMGYVFLIIAIIAAGSARIFFSTISGVILYETPFVESLVYNGTKIGISLALVVILLILLFPFLAALNKEKQSD